MSQEQELHYNNSQNALQTMQQEKESPPLVDSPPSSSASEAPHKQQPFRKLSKKHSSVVLLPAIQAYHRKSIEQMVSETKGDFPSVEQLSTQDSLPSFVTSPVHSSSLSQQHLSTQSGSRSALAKLASLVGLQNPRESSSTASKQNNLSQKGMLAQSQTNLTNPMSVSTYKEERNNLRRHLASIGSQDRTINTFSKRLSLLNNGIGKKKQQQKEQDQNSNINRNATGSKSSNLLLNNNNMNSYESSPKQFGETQQPTPKSQYSSISFKPQAISKSTQSLEIPHSVLSRFQQDFSSATRGDPANRLNNHSSKRISILVDAIPEQQSISKLNQQKKRSSIATIFNKIDGTGQPINPVEQQQSQLNSILFAPNTVASAGPPSAFLSQNKSQRKKSIFDPSNRSSYHIPLEMISTAEITEQNEQTRSHSPSNISNGSISKRKDPRSIHYCLEDIVLDSGEISTNIGDKFEFFKSVPVGAHILTKTTTTNMTIDQRKKTTPSQPSSPSMKMNANLNSILNKPSLFSSIPAVKEHSLPHPSSSSSFSHGISPFFYGTPPAIPQNHSSAATSLNVKHSKQHKSQFDIVNQTASPLLLNRNLKESRVNSPRGSVQGRFLSNMSSRMAAFFRNENQEKVAQLYRELVIACRNFKRNIDSLISLEKNSNKSIVYLQRLLGSKPYLLNELIEVHFKVIHLNKIDMLENLLISESFLKRHFSQTDDLSQILANSYVKDLIYANGILEAYINNKQTSAATKISHEIQWEYSIVKQKEKELITDKINAYLDLMPTANPETHPKIKSYNYPFFNGYLYNIHPHRNPYKEIQNFEKELGPLPFLNPIEREVFSNLDKSYSEIRAKNQM